MAVPRLESLTYRVIAVDRDPEWLSRARAIDVSIGDFDCHVEDGWLTAKPRRHFDDEQEARVELEPSLQAWEATTELQAGTRIRFQFHGCRIEDPRPEEGVWGRIEVEFQAASERDEAMPVLPIPTDFPEPSTQPFSETASLRLLRKRIRDYREGRDRLLAVGYYAYTLIARESGGAKSAPSRLKVDEEVLETLNELTSKRSHPQHERKAIRAPRLTEAEREWVEAALVSLAMRLGEMEAGAKVTPLTMGDLPPL